MQVIDVKTWKATARGRWRPVKGRRDRVRQSVGPHFLGLQQYSVVVDPNTGKIVATIKNGTRVDALGWDPSKKLVYVPNGGEATSQWSTRIRPTSTRGCHGGHVRRRETIAVDTASHNVYLFQRSAVRRRRLPLAPSHGQGGRAAAQGPIVASWFIAIKQ